VSGQESFISHLVELRTRLLRALSAIAVVFIALMFWRARAISMTCSLRR